MTVRIAPISYHGVARVRAECVTRNHTGTAVLYGSLSLTLHGERGDSVDIDVFGSNHTYLHGLACAINDFNAVWSAAQRAANQINAALAPAKAAE